LSELARATTMSKATLSGIENGRANPTIETLAALAAALRVSVSELLEEAPLGEVRVVRRAGSAFTARGALAQRGLEAIDAGAGSALTEIAVEPRRELELGPEAAGARACVFVLEGPLVAGPVERSTELGVGDYMSFPADAPYVYATGRSAARALQLIAEA
jgi:transcriptional regulator with XRE-family HTH domain